MTQGYGPVIPGEGSPIGKTYLSVAVTEAGVDRQLVPGTRIRVTVRKDGVFIAIAGCNQLSGVIQVVDGLLRFEPHIQTQVGCGPELEAQDDWLAGLLMQSDGVVDGDTLTLTSGGTTLVLLDRRLANPDFPLEGSTWQVESVVRGDVFEHFILAGPRSLVVIGKAGLTINGTHVTGSTGSSSFTATVSRDGSTLVFSELTVETTHPRGRAADLEQVVLENLRTPLTYTIESNRMKLRGPTRTTGLNLVAVRPDGSPAGSL
ncbi:META domain-containing protein [Kribbella kalugense]|uniref:META domain-containing protein n=1 Tax=Kribbella kalugense TaxID=2512221 RepID=A0A4R8A0Z9_9ACTN|nr:META domain-containing protein [Kribbella kalugense]TDW23875.1 META domain-containing protein [Kribbella kalugense]